MSWIKTIPFKESEGRLRSIYDRIAGPDGYIDNILLLHSLRPHTLQGHMRLYKAVLHHSGNSLDPALLETIGVYVSMLNRCAYCVEHHFSGLRGLVNDERAYAIHDALGAGDFSHAFDEREAAILTYAKTVTLSPRDISEKHIAALRRHGLSDGEILEINQTCAYFAYANRTVLGLGCSTDGDILGLSPGNEETDENWLHA
jgi:uncharacterized peroxidase-related enzyme